MSRYKILPILSFLMLLVLNTADAQCVSGDCENGFGTWKWDNGTIYKGEFQNKARGGYGYYLFENGDIYVGEWQNNERHGYGVYYFSDHSAYKRYSGEWRANQRSGMGILHFSDENIAPRFGVWENSKFKHKYEDLDCLEGDCYNGFGVYVWNDGARYEGNFVEGKRNGEGVYYYSKGSKYVGTQENDRRHGWGTYYYASGSKYVGEWVYETKEGRGTFYSKGQIAEKCIYVAGKCSEKQPNPREPNDKKAPVISIIHPEVIALRNGGPRVVVKQQTIHVEGKASDESGIEQVRTSGAISELSIVDKKTTRFVGKVSLSVGQNTFWVEATDKAGNTIKEEFQIIYVPEEPVLVINDPITSPDNNGFGGTTVIRKSNVKKISENRTALVIGNASYTSVPALRNPKNDAIAIAAELQGMDFEVELRTDASEEEMIVAIREFGARLKLNGGVGLFYYAGHGLQVNGENFLVPIDAEINKSSDIELESVRLKRALNELEFADNRMNIVILDACRDNPYPAEVRKISGPGLSQTNAPQGTYIAYSTSPGKAASDGSGEHGLYTEMLLRALQESEGVKLEDVFKTVRKYVLNGSEGLQTPWENSSITGDFYFKY
jgi:hypothetical protein